MRLNLETVHPQALSGIGVNYNKGGGGTFVAAKGLASVNRTGNKFINSKNANISKGQFEGAPPVHQTQHHSNSLGRDSLKSAGGMVNFEQQAAPGISGSQGPAPHQAAKTGVIGQNPNLSNHGGQNHGQAQFSRQTTSHVPGNSNVKTFKLNEIRDLSKQKHQEELAQGHGS